MARIYDFTVFGATGFTGKKIAKLLSEKVASKDSKAFKICISGRNHEKLEKVKATMDDTASVDILVADINDNKSIDEMTRLSFLVLNCAGPYRYYGEPIVKSCVENGTHYMDISGEPEFIENMELKYKEAAAENGCFIVSGVGFDSIPADLGCIFTQRQFEHPNIPAYVESFLTVDSKGSNAQGHYATYESAVMGFANQHKLKAIREKAGPKNIPYVGGVCPREQKPFYNAEREAYSLPFPGSDRSIVRRTQYFLHQKEETATPYGAFFDVKSRRTLYMVGLFGSVLGVFAKYSSTRNLMLRYPRFFSGGAFSHEGPSEKDMESTTFTMDFIGKGFSNASMMETGSEPDVTVKTRIHGPEPGYVACSIIITESALCFTENLDKIIEFVGHKGGVLTTGSVFYPTDLIERLDTAGIHFEVL